MADNGGRIDVNRSDLSCTRQDGDGAAAAVGRRPILLTRFTEKARTTTPVNGR